MNLGQVRPAVLLVCLLAGIVASSEAAVSKRESQCSLTIGKAGASFVKRKFKLLQACRNNELAGGTCAAADTAAVAKVDAALAAALTKACALIPAELKALGFPGPCTDAEVTDGFTTADLVACIRTSHDAIIGAMLAVQYDAAVAPVLGKEDLACQREVAVRSAALVGCTLGAIRKCRAAIASGKLVGVPAHLCASDDPKAAAAISKCRARLHDGLAAKCGDARVADLFVCDPDQTTVEAAATCLVDAHTVRTDGPAIDVPPDLVDYEYAVRGGLCGDGVVNHLNEECDGADDAACLGACGAPSVPDGYFACLCKTKPRLRIVEHGAADTDNGWTGNSTDSGVVEGGGYVVDLYDCDGAGLCDVGPSCSLAPHSPCGVEATAPSGTTGNSICSGLGQGVCRKERTAVGPHCFQDIQKKCDLDTPSDPVCDAPGDFCATTLAAPPNPVTSGGVNVCNVTIFSEDVVGTANILTGESTVRARQQARTYNNLVGGANKPCPVCGGFCGGSRNRCASNADCPADTGPCVTAEVCSNGPNANRPCRATMPFGSAVPFFGTTSIDCPPEPLGEITDGAGLDLNITTRSTGVVTMLPSEPCATAPFTDDACLGGTSEGRPCAAASECPGGSCAPQCFCPGQLKPNPCAPACVGGGNDAAECAADSQCPGGFCHAGDCRVDPDDDDSVQEGLCTVGQADGKCSTTTHRACSDDLECSPPSCPSCVPGETCVFSKRPCFVNSGIVRQGTPRTPEGASAGVYCIQGNNSAVNTVAGFPGPAAFTQPERAIVVP